MKILVTGSSGFLGAKVLDRLRGDAVALSRSTSASRFAQHYSVDLSIKKQVKEFIKNYRGDRISHIVHCAAVTPWSKNLDYSLDLQIAKNVADMCRDLSVPNLIFISGWIVYDMKNAPPYSEETPLAASNPYGRSKLEVENYFKNSLKTTKLITLRVSSVYGPGQLSVGLIPNLTKSAIAKGEIAINSKKTKRDYLYVDDFVDAVMNSLKLKTNEHLEINIGSGHSVSVEEVAKTTQEIFATEWNKKIKIHANQRLQESTPIDNRLAIDKALKLKIIGELTEFKVGLRGYIRWLKNENNF